MVYVLLTLGSLVVFGVLYPMAVRETLRNARLAEAQHTTPTSTDDPAEAIDPCTESLTLTPRV